MQVSTIGVDLAKNVFQVHGVDSSGRVVIWVMGVKARANDWDPIRGFHQGQRSWCRANRPDV